MLKWIRGRFKDVPTAFASAMAIIGVLGVLCCAAIICIVLMHPKP